MIKYLGRLQSNCEMCNKYQNTHHYEHELFLKELYPKDYKTKLCICEKCAKREVGKRQWNKIKRKVK